MSIVRILARAVGPVLGAQELLHLALHAAVPVVLDGVVSAARQQLGDLCPPVAEGVVGFQNGSEHKTNVHRSQVMGAIQHQQLYKPQQKIFGIFGCERTKQNTFIPVLLLAPGGLVNIGIQVVVPALPTLFADSTGQLLRDLRPFLRSDLSHQLYDGLIFLLRPGTLCEARVEDLGPPMKALNLRFTRQIIRHQLPVLSVESANSLPQHIVLKQKNEIDEYWKMCMGKASQINRTDKRSPKFL